MALNQIQRRLVEMIRGQKKVAVTINAGTPDEIVLTMGGCAPREIALAVQTAFDWENDKK